MTGTSDDHPGFLKQYGPALVVATIVGGAVAGIAVFVSKGKKEAPARPQETIVRLAPLPPPPPPPPPPPKPKEPDPKPDEEPKPADDKMVAQEPVAKDEPKPAEAPPPAEPPAEAVGTSIKGDGPNNFGLGFSKTGGGNGVIGGSGSGNGTGAGGGVGGSRWGWYAGKVQSQVRTVLLTNKKTRAAAMRITVRIWADAAGKVTRAKLDGGTGDAELDTAIRDEVLPGLTLSEPPPDGMPMPIVMRITAKRP